VIPAYNEEKNIGQVLDKLLKLKELYGFDVLVVDDCSADRTGVIAIMKGAHVIRHDRNMGEEGGIQTGLKYALKNNYNFVIKIDGDGQHDPEDVPAVIKALCTGADLVIGERQGRYDESLLFKLGRWACNLLLSILIGRKCGDTTSGFYGFNKRCMTVLRAVHDKTPMLKNDLTNNLEKLIIAWKVGLKIVKVPVVMHARREASKCYFSYRLLVFPLLLLISLMRCLLMDTRWLVSMI